MIQFFLYTLLSLSIIFFFGYGLSYLVLPKRLNKYLFWLIPWVFFTINIVFFTLLNLAGISLKNIYIPISILLSILSIYVLKKETPVRFSFNINLIIFIFVFASIILNVSPLIRRDKALTTITLGNNDIIAYTTSADYLKTNSIFKSFNDDVILTIDNLLHDGFRWGPSINESYFLNILNLEGYQYTYLFEVIIYALMIPLVYVIANMLYPKIKPISIILLLTLITFNSNMLYMLYHNFFGLIQFWGLGLFLLILLINYFTNRFNNKSINRDEILISLSIVSIYFSYHEAIIFILFPLGLFLAIKLLLNHNYKLIFYSYLRIGLTSLLFGSIAIINALIFDFGQAFRGNPNQPIGWQLFREKLPFANPVEIIGFYSIHNFPPMLNIIAIILSLIVLLIFINGIAKIKFKLFILSFLTIDLFFLFWMGYIKNNFFDYNRVITYTLPLFLIIFTIGIDSLLKWKKTLNLFITILIVTSTFSGLNLNKLFIQSRLSVDSSLRSLKELKLNKINEPVYAGGFVDEAIPLWQQIWIGYFLYPNDKSSILYPKIFVKDKFSNKVPDGKIVLIQKKAPWINPTSLVLKKIIWENSNYKLGRICNSNQCLEDASQDLSRIIIGSSEVEDSLLITGWSNKEGTYRWANAFESTLRLISKPNQDPTKLLIEALTLKSPQKISVMINDILVGQADLNNKWNRYSFDLPDNPNRLYNIVFKYSNLYKPVDLGFNLDNRDLSVSFKSISLE